MSKRYNPDKNIGLSKEQVNERIKDNLVNFNTNVKTKSAKEIILENTVTLFNIINVILAVAIILVGSYKNLGFLLIIVLNTVISTFQELHSKSVIDKLSVVSASKVKVLRDSKEYDVNLDEVVLDDIIILELGNQVITDAIIVDGVVEVDESFITGESDTLIKKEGDMLLSGSFIVSGNAKAKVEHIGYDNYTAKISSDTKYIKPISSEIMRSLNKIVKTISVIIVPLGILLFARQLYLSGNTLQNAVVNTVAAIIGMIPEGLVLLTSTVFAVSVIRLSKEKVLVQDLYCIESLARVDVICLDKTGTITEGKMEVVDVIPLDGETKASLGDILGSMMAATKDKNATAIAIRDAYYRKPKWKVEEVIPFSSEKKYSGVKFATDTYLIGAVEFVLKDHGKSYQKMLDDYIKKYRVLVLVKVNNYGKKNEERKALGFILLQDKVRKEAKKTLEYFKEQGVAIKSE